MITFLTFTFCWQDAFPLLEGGVLMPFGLRSDERHAHHLNTTFLGGGPSKLLT